MRTSASRRAVIGAVGLALALTGCGSNGGDNSAGGGGTQGEFKVGVFGPAQIVQGQDIKAGAELAAAQLNKAGGIGGAKITTVFCDTENGAKPERAIACVTQFAEKDEVDAIVGGFSSAETLAALDTIVKSETLFLGTGAGAKGLVEGVDATGDRRFIFRVGPVNTTALATDICLAHVTGVAPATGFTKFGILYEDTEAAVAIQKFLQKCLPSPAEATNGLIDVKKGVEIVGTESHLPDATDFSAQFRALEKAGAQYVVEVNSRQEGVPLVAQWGQLKPAFGLGGFNVSSQADGFFAATGKAAAGELNGPAGILRTEITPKTIPFYDAFKKEFGRDPIYNAASTYDAFHLLAEAAKAADSTDTEALIKQLGSANYQGVQGRISFDKSHDVVYGAGDPTKGLTPLHFQWAADGTRTIVFPKAFADGPYTKPAWLR
jgi:branched-chain amino acid transport system substrate-binding protein